jgi:hypothetical protein
LSTFNVRRNRRRSQGKEWKGKGIGFTSFCQ